MNNIPSTGNNINMYVSDSFPQETDMTVNVVKNTKRALEMGLKGTICQFADHKNGWTDDAPETYNNAPEWKYEALKEANKLLK